MKETLQTYGPAVGEGQLVDVYRASPGEHSPWVAISDQVMGGESSGAIAHDEREGSPCTCLTGRTSLENNGGFLQMKLQIEPEESLADYDGLFIELCGPAHDYNLNVKTTQLEKPWQSYRCTLSIATQWTRFVVPYAALSAHRTDVEFDSTKIRSVAVIAFGEAFDVEVCVRRFGFYR